MALSFKTTDPDRLLKAFKKAIDDGRVVTWSYDPEGDFTHTAEQWKNSAWLRPKVRTERLVFNIIKPKNRNISSVVYAVFHGRFIESMLTHCDKLFTDADATSFPSTGDRVSE